MNQQVVLTHGSVTDISHLQGKNIMPKQLVLEGEGKLHSCILTFGVEHDNINGQKEILFLKPLHEKGEILLPHIKDFSLHGFNYCYIEVFTGKVSAHDRLVLHLAPHNAAKK